MPHHFSSKLDFMNTDFRSVSLFRKTNQFELTFADDIVSFFEQATPIHWSVMTNGFCLATVFLILFCCVCYLKIPEYLAKLLCCFENICFLKKRVITILSELQHLKNLYTNTRNQTVYRNYQANDLTENEQLNVSFPP